jgi:hypothetical protein
VPVDRPIPIPQPYPVVKTVAVWVKFKKLIVCSSSENGIKCITLFVLRPQPYPVDRPMWVLFK